MPGDSFHFPPVYQEEALEDCVIIAGLHPTLTTELDGERI